MSGEPAASQESGIGSIRSVFSKSIDIASSFIGMFYEKLIRGAVRASLVTLLVCVWREELLFDWETTLKIEKINQGILGY